MGPIRPGAMMLCLAALLLLTGCFSDISIMKVGEAGRAEYSAISASGITQATGNLLGNFLLEETFLERPFELVGELEKLFRAEPHSEYLSAMADCSLNIGLRYRRKPDTAVRFFLSAALYSYSYLALLDQPDLKPYNADRLQMMRIYNIAISELFSYLSDRELAQRASFTLNAAGGQRVNFQSPQFKLPLPAEQIEEFLLCADYRPRNLTHISRRPGIGAPLICSLKQEVIEGTAGAPTRFAEQQTFPGTLMIKFDKEEELITAALHFLDPKATETVMVGEHELPLEMDFSTPLAYMVRHPLPFGHLVYMLRPEETRRMQGLYRLEPYRSDRIPVVFVHGLMSSIRTWMQMLNTLQSDPVLQKHYQFWGFTYSSGNPVLFTGAQLRDALLQEQAKLQADGESTEMFSRMVLIGHSMGGLVAKSAVLEPGKSLLVPVFGNKVDEALTDLTPEQRKNVEDVLYFKPLPFVKRVIYLAVPHEGSEYASYWIARLGSTMVELPLSLVTRGEGIIKTLMDHGLMMPNDSKIATGIDNLDPRNRTLQVLNQLPYASGVKYHSIIGNRRAAGVPGGSDGIVPYLSSHLDGAQSELIVKSGHSVQLNPLAIQELRRILLEHLHQFPDLNVKPPELPGLVNRKNDKLFKH